MERRSEVFDNFSGGITSELRTNYEVPKFARLWNFDVSTSRAVQHGGLRRESTGEAHIVDFETDFITTGEDWFMNQHTSFSVEENGDVELLTMTTGVGNANFTLDSDVQMSTLPVMYNNHLVWQDQNLDIWMKPIFPFGAGFRVLEGLPADQDHEQNTFFQKAIDGRLYVLSGKRVHRLELPDSSGSFNSQGELDAYLPITQQMQIGNRNGEVGTINGILGPETQVITQIDNAQNILTILGYYTGPIDGVFNAEFEQAVIDFQLDHNATGAYDGIPGGQPAGQPLPGTGNLGVETASVLNAVDDNNNKAFREVKNVLVLPDIITAVCQNGGVLNIAVKDSNGDAVVYYWDKTLSAEGIGDQGLLTSVVVGKGIVQILRPLNGRLMAITSPATDSLTLHKYVNMSIYAIQAGFDILPESFANPIAEYRLRVGPDGNINNVYRHNIINQKSQVANSRIYFTGTISLQQQQEANNGEGIYSGVMSIDSSGNLFTEVAQSDNGDDFTYEQALSFGMLDSGFILATINGVYVTDVTENDNVSGLITKIINGDRPWERKQVDNIFLSMLHTDDVDNVEIWIREVEDFDDNDAGWELAYEGNMQDINSIQINRMEDGQPFWQFKELQVMVKVFGTLAELNNLTVTYNMLAINE